MYRLIAIVQARTSSTRLPRKIFTKIGDKFLLEHVIDRLRLAKNVSDIIIATTTKPCDDEICEWADLHDIKYFRGDENNVLERYYLCAREFACERFVRVTSDCPFLDPSIIDRLITLSEKNNCDYASLHGGGERVFPHGLDLEVVRFEALQKAYNEARSKLDKEHVCTYLYKTSPDDFRLCAIEPLGGERDPSIRITVDTKQDLLAMRELYTLLPKDFNAKTIVKIYQNNPHLKEINRV